MMPVTPPRPLLIAVFDILPAVCCLVIIEPVLARFIVMCTNLVALSLSFHIISGPSTHQIHVQVDVDEQVDVDNAVSVASIASSHHG